MAKGKTPIPKLTRQEIELQITLAGNCDPDFASQLSVALNSLLERIGDGVKILK